MTAPLPRDAEEFLSWLEVERGRSPRTLAAYRRDLGTYQEDVTGRGHDIDAATSADVAAHLEALRRTHGASSVARALSSIRGFHRFLVEEGLRGDDPTLDLPSISVTDMLPKALSEEETELTARGRRRHRSDGPARPGPPGGPLRHRRPRERGRGAEPR